MIINTLEGAITKLRYVQLDSDFSPEHIIHMILGTGPSQTLYNVSLGIHQSAVEFLCRETRNLPNYPIPGGIVKEDEMSRPYFCKGTRSFPVNEHPNEFLGTFAVAGVNFHNTKIVTEKGNEGSLIDMAEAAMQKYSDSTEEPSWSLMTFSVHPGVTKEWKNEKGEVLSVESILGAACARPYGTGACFGTHIIEGVAFAVSRYCFEQDLELTRLTGAWQEGFEYVSSAIHLMKRNQRDDGSIDRCWFKAKSFPAHSSEWKEKIKDLTSRYFKPSKAIIYPTGHCLDAISPLSLFLTQDRGWIDSACYILAHTIEMDWVSLARELSPVTHAVHALKLIGE